MQCAQRESVVRHVGSAEVEPADVGGLEPDGRAAELPVVSVGPQLAAGIGDGLAEQFTKNLGTPPCSPSPDPGAQSGQVSPEPKGSKERAKARAQERRRAQDATAPVAGDPCATP